MKTRMPPAVVTIAMISFLPCLSTSATVKWKHLSTVNGDLPVPNPGKEQTASLVCDIDRDGVNDFAIAERTRAPALVWYRRGTSGWTRYIVEGGPLHIEAGSDALDIDRDGDLDIVFAGDWQNNQVWWWENPCPDFDPQKSWKRHTIKEWGGNKHHDLMFGDFYGNGKQELVFWNQGSNRLFLAEIPPRPREAQAWACPEVYFWGSDGEMWQRQTRPYPSFKAVNEHEGLAKVDIDGDGKLEIVGGGRWFAHVRGSTFLPYIIDAGYQFTRAAAGQLIEGGRPEVVFVVGDGWAPLMMYEWQKGTWVPTEVIHEVDCGHSLALVDFNKDGHLDIWVAEMRLNDGNPDAKNMLLLGDGKGHFETTIISEGIENHESKIADLDGDGDLDILGKPYNWQTPRLDIWLNEGKP